MSDILILITVPILIFFLVLTFINKYKLYKARRELLELQEKLRYTTGHEECCGDEIDVQDQEHLIDVYNKGKESQSQVDKLLKNINYYHKETSFFMVISILIFLALVMYVVIL